MSAILSVSVLIQPYDTATLFRPNIGKWLIEEEDEDINVAVTARGVHG